MAFVGAEPRIVAEGVSGLRIILDTASGKLLLVDGSEDGRFAEDVRLWNESAVPPPAPPPPPKRAPGRPRKAATSPHLNV
jgi:hypothetical protein